MAVIRGHTAELGEPRHCPGWWADRFLQRDRDEQQRAQLETAVVATLARLDRSTARERAIALHVLNERIDAYNAMTTVASLDRVE